MNPEKPVKVLLEQIPKLSHDFTPSVTTGFSADTLARMLLTGEKLKPAEVATMVEGVAGDLKTAGVPITKDDVTAVTDRAQKAFSSSPDTSSSQAKAPKTQEIQDKPLKEIDLKEYKQVLENIFQTYQMDNNKWNAISGIYAANQIVGDVIGGIQGRVFQTDTGRRKAWLRLNAITRGLDLKKIKINQLTDKLKKISQDKPKAATLARHLFNVTWPFTAGAVHYWFLERWSNKQASVMFRGERAKLQERVNSRIADSVYMRQFEFVHDKPPGEMLEIINRGKDATVDLMSSIHMYLVPIKASIWGSMLRQTIINPLDLVPSLIKKFTLETRIKPNATAIQKQRDEELKRWDKVNTKLVTTLSGLETVRTSGTAQEGSDTLYNTLAERDFIEAGGFSQKLSQDRVLNNLFDVVDVGFPVVTEGIRFIKNTHGRELSAYQSFDSLLNAYFRVGSSRGQQQMLHQSMRELVRLYVDHIVPDIQDIQRMDELLGPYTELDHPLGLKERARIPVAKLSNYDISVKNLRFKNILHDVNMDIPQGAFVTIKGPSGIGKTTFFRHLVGLYEGAEGAVSYGGVDLQKIKKYGDDSIYTKIAYANQSPQLFEDMSLRDNLLLWTKHDISDEKVRLVLRDLNLEHLEDRLDTVTKHFSGGEMRRIGIARALLKDPKVLFLDEPTANLDQESAQQVLDIIQKMRKTHKAMTVIAVTHDAAFEKIAEKVVDFRDINKLSDEDRGKLGNRQVFYAAAKP